MKTATQPSEHAYLCAMWSDDHGREAPVAFSLLKVTEPLQGSVASAYDQLARGIPGDIEIPVVAAVLRGGIERIERQLNQSTVPGAQALLAILVILSLKGERGWFAVSAPMAEAFAMIASQPTRSNALLVVNRHAFPTIRSRVSRGRRGSKSLPVEPITPTTWHDRPTPQSFPLRLVRTHQ